MGCSLSTAIISQYEQHPPLDFKYVKLNSVVRNGAKQDAQTAEVTSW